MLNDIPSGVSMESAAYVENNIDNISSTSKEIIEEYTPKLFSEDQNFQESTIQESKESAPQESEELFDKDINEEEDFEIPAFLRKQKF